MRPNRTAKAGRHSRGGRIGRLRGFAYDLLALAARIGVGAVFAADGWQALASTGPGALGPPWSNLWPAAAWAEIACGAALAAGLASPLAGMGLAFAAIAALWPPHSGGGIPAGGNGYELAIVLIPTCLLLAVHAGRLSADYLLLRLMRARKHPATQACPPLDVSAKRPENAPPLPYAGHGHTFEGKRRVRA